MLRLGDIVVIDNYRAHTSPAFARSSKRLGDAEVLAKILP
jgi:hypothetical protein